MGLRFLKMTILIKAHDNPLRAKILLLPLRPKSSSEHGDVQEF
ncbi:MAG: hypothetical protein RLZZ294_1308 [Bacteroidota bacterium]|jgi:hypothetical protein